MQQADFCFKSRMGLHRLNTKAGPLRSGLRGLSLSLMLGGPAVLRWFWIRLIPLHFSLLVLLQFLRLLSVLLLQLVLLPLLAALELVTLLLIGSPLFQFLLFLDVPLLHLLAFCILLLAHLFCFSLVLLLQPRIYARGVRGPRRRRTVFESAPVVLRRSTRTICLLPAFTRSVFEGAAVSRRCVS